MLISYAEKLFTVYLTPSLTLSLSQSNSFSLFFTLSFSLSQYLFLSHSYSFSLLHSLCLPLFPFSLSQSLSFTHPLLHPLFLFHSLLHPFFPFTLSLSITAMTIINITTIGKMITEVFWNVTEILYDDIILILDKNKLNWTPLMFKLKCISFDIVFP